MPRSAPSTAVRGFFGVGVYRPKHEVNIGSLWRTAVAYDAAFLATVGRRYRAQASDTGNAALHAPLYHYPDLDDLIEHLPHSCPIVGVELDPRATPLDRFRHPERALYLLGAEDHGLPPKVIDRCHYLVAIPSALPRSLNVAVAGGIVVAHRYLATCRQVPGLSGGQLCGSTPARPPNPAI
jgi:tRNA G18 (ribose-2'-O)-methylase SpoU